MEWSIDDCWAALAEDPFNLECVPKNIKTKEICLFCVKKNGNCIKYVPKKILDEDICIEAIQKNPDSIQYVPNKFVTIEICLQLLLENWQIAKNIPFENFTKEFQSELINNILCVLSVEYLSNILFLLLRTCNFTAVFDENKLLKIFLLFGLNSKQIKEKITILGYLKNEFEVKIFRLLNEIMNEGNNKFKTLNKEFLDIIGLHKIDNNEFELMGKQFIGFKKITKNFETENDKFKMKKIKKDYPYDDSKQELCCECHDIYMINENKKCFNCNNNIKKNEQGFNISIFDNEYINENLTEHEKTLVILCCEDRFDDFMKVIEVGEKENINLLESENCFAVLLYILFQKKDCEIMMQYVFEKAKKFNHSNKITYTFFVLSCKKGYLETAKWFWKHLYISEKKNAIEHCYLIIEDLQNKIVETKNKKLENIIEWLNEEINIIIINS